MNNVNKLHNNSESSTIMQSTCLYLCINTMMKLTARLKIIQCLLCMATVIQWRYNDNNSNNENNDNHNDNGNQIDSNNYASDINYNKENDIPNDSDNYVANGNYNDDDNNQYKFQNFIMR